MLRQINGTGRGKIVATGRACRLAGQLGMSLAVRPGVPASLAGTGAGGACRLCTACCETLQDGERPSCANAGVLQEMLYKNLLWRQ